MLVPTLQQRKSEIASRLSTFQRYIGLSGADACILEDPYDLFYFTGLDLSAGRLWISIKGAALFVDSRYIDVALKESLVQPVFLLKKKKRKNLSRKSALYMLYSTEQKHLITGQVRSRAS
jgi:Xaa-Pro aminopeptidase